MALVSIMALYFIPTMIAVVRNHRNIEAIGMLNLLLGWTFIGWVGALVWSTTAPPARESS